MIHITAQILTAFVALEHIYILWMEMYAWETAGKRVFGKSLPEHLFKPTKKMAANQGLYNGFLAAGLIWSFFISDLIWVENIQLFFLGCVAVAGIYGSLTTSRKIFVVQALPALLSMLFVIL
jgi:putative membrane protein